jgi:macrolide-specific efflux system membrane fusion protein
MKRKLAALVVLIVVATAAIAVTFGNFGAAAATSTQYLTTQAARGDVSDDVAATGSLASATTYGLVFGADPYLITSSDTAAPQSTRPWPVTDVRVKPGDSVQEGQVLATAATADAQRDLATATGTLRTANINLATAEDQLSTAEDSGTDAQVNQAKIGLYAAQSAKAKASQDRNAILKEIKAATLRAPIAGIVTAVNVSKGFDAPAGAAITIASPTLNVTTDVVESDLASIKTGQTANVSVTAIDSSLTGTVTAISPTASTSSQGVVSYPVTITIQDPPPTARAGMSADVTITTASATNVLVVPASALQGATGNYSVLVLEANGTTRRVPVEVGLVTNAMAEIKSGLSEGMNVVTGTTADLVGTNTNNGRFGGGAFPGGGTFRQVDGGPRDIKGN